MDKFYTQKPEFLAKVWGFKGLGLIGHTFADSSGSTQYPVERTVNIGLIYCQLTATPLFAMVPVSYALTGLLVWNCVTKKANNTII